eukprot:MONOS_1642.1-p1 / transcript=MONOS_1642.1 / gene=MONOS_1642 / organism=Monocercomonoides_exilis_PA203 / gene_product=unspecified product / transcript_product=unspecified product / location=Mono_scaffold00030:70957-77790(-) / protein_length=2149 / sequence_SO=supercontig / SO=protein_coding / is_pseudo=false
MRTSNSSYCQFLQKDTKVEGFPDGSYPLSSVLKRLPVSRDQKRLSAVEKLVSVIDKVAEPYKKAEIVYLSNNVIVDLSGIEQFVQVKILSLNYNKPITSQERGIARSYLDQEEANLGLIYSTDQLLKQSKNALTIYLSGWRPPKRKDPLHNIPSVGMGFEHEDGEDGEMQEQFGGERRMQGLLLNKGIETDDEGIEDDDDDEWVRVTTHLKNEVMKAWKMRFPNDMLFRNADRQTSSERKDLGTLSKRGTERKGRTGQIDEDAQKGGRSSSQFSSRSRSRSRSQSPLPSIHESWLIAYNDVMLGQQQAMTQLLLAIDALVKETQPPMDNSAMHSASFSLSDENTYSGSPLKASAITRVPIPSVSYASSASSTPQSQNRSQYYESSPTSGNMAFSSPSPGHRNLLFSSPASPTLQHLRQLIEQEQLFEEEMRRDRDSEKDQTIKQLQKRIRENEMKEDQNEVQANSQKMQTVGTAVSQNYPYPRKEQNSSIENEQSSSSKFSSDKNVFDSEDKTNSLTNDRFDELKDIQPSNEKRDRSNTSETSRTRKSRREEQEPIDYDAALQSSMLVLPPEEVARKTARSREERSASRDRSEGRSRLGEKGRLTDRGKESESEESDRETRTTITKRSYPSSKKRSSIRSDRGRGKDKEKTPRGNKGKMNERKQIGMPKKEYEKKKVPKQRKDSDDEDSEEILSSSMSLPPRSSSTPPSFNSMTGTSNKNVKQIKIVKQNNDNVDELNGLESSFPAASFSSSSSFLQRQINSPRTQQQRDRKVQLVVENEQMQQPADESSLLKGKHSISEGSMKADQIFERSKIANGPNSVLENTQPFQNSSISASFVYDSDLTAEQANKQQNFPVDVPNHSAAVQPKGKEQQAVSFVDHQKSNDAANPSLPSSQNAPPQTELYSTVFTPPSLAYTKSPFAASLPPPPLPPAPIAPSVAFASASSPLPASLPPFPNSAEKSLNPQTIAPQMQSLGQSLKSPLTSASASASSPIISSQKPPLPPFSASKTDQLVGKTVNVPASFIKEQNEISTAKDDSKSYSENKLANGALTQKNDNEFDPNATHVLLDNKWTVKEPGSQQSYPANPVETTQIKSMGNPQSQTSKGFSYSPSSPVALSSPITTSNLMASSSSPLSFPASPTNFASNHLNNSMQSSESPDLDLSLSHNSDSDNHVLPSTSTFTRSQFTSPPQNVHSQSANQNLLSESNAPAPKQFEQVLLEKIRLNEENKKLHDEIARLEELLTKNENERSAKLLSAKNEELKELKTENDQLKQQIEDGNKNLEALIEERVEERAKEIEMIAAKKERKLKEENEIIELQKKEEEKRKEEKRKEEQEKNEQRFMEELKVKDKELTAEKERNEELMANAQNLERSQSMLKSEIDKIQDEKAEIESALEQEIQRRKEDENRYLDAEKSRMKEFVKEKEKIMQEMEEHEKKWAESNQEERKMRQQAEEEASRTNGAYHKFLKKLNEKIGKERVIQKAFTAWRNLEVNRLIRRQNIEIEILRKEKERITKEASFKDWHRTAQSEKEKLRETSLISRSIDVLRVKKQNELVRKVFYRWLRWKEDKRRYENAMRMKLKENAKERKMTLLMEWRLLTAKTVDRKSDEVKENLKLLSSVLSETKAEMDGSNKTNADLLLQIIRNSIRSSGEQVPESNERFQDFVSKRKKLLDETLLKIGATDGKIDLPDQQSLPQVNASSFSASRSSEPSLSESDVVPILSEQVERLSKENASQIMQIEKRNSIIEELNKELCEERERIKQLKNDIAAIKKEKNGVEDSRRRENEEISELKEQHSTDKAMWAHAERQLKEDIKRLETEKNELLRQIESERDRNGRIKLEREKEKEKEREKMQEVFAIASRQRDILMEREEAFKKLKREKERLEQSQKEESFFIDDSANGQKMSKAEAIHELKHRLKDTEDGIKQKNAIIQEKDELIDALKDEIARRELLIDEMEMELKGMNKSDIQQSSQSQQSSYSLSDRSADFSESHQTSPSLQTISSSRITDFEDSSSSSRTIKQELNSIKSNSSPSSKRNSSFTSMPEATHSNSYSSHPSPPRPLARESFLASIQSSSTYSHDSLSNASFHHNTPPSSPSFSSSLSFSNSSSLSSTTPAQVTSLSSSTFPESSQSTSLSDLSEHHSVLSSSSTES